ncbi:sensor histidine kinase [Ramlibacter ginsenosidimutans]|uniref:histidine kinase n=1 Tax=Ramlibacter ginsenosidimutans TaxID=502333 RepID=A0A934WQN4_9BURK|nr:sensor histidine kinase [Ramlibacter ginsenosidimutans]MBK6009440.1 sensor histidine kinase [Ramlibacter ginsenosidimutans]
MAPQPDGPAVNAAQPPPPTLGQRLLRTVLLPLAITWIAGAAVSFSVAQYFTQQTFDRSLLDDASLLAAHVRMVDGRLRLELSPAEIRAVLYDQTETVYFSVHAADGTVVAGEPLLPMGAEGARPFHFDDVPFDEKILRAVRLWEDVPAPFEVTVAQTTSSRNAALRQLMFYSLLPQLGLLVLLALWLRRSIGRDVRPLGTLRHALEDRGSQDLSPVPTEASTRDVQSLAAAINALLQRLGRSIRAQKEFAGNVAHELRTPLAGIRALAEYGLGRQDPAVWRQQLEAIAASEVRATALVDRLLAVALAAEAESALELKPVALDAAVREAVLRYLRRADAAGVDLGALGIDARVWVEAEPTLLEGILNNLIDNALRYGGGGGSPPAITVAVERRDGEVVLSVQDNGPGVPHEQQLALAERGAQGEAGQLLGEGVGLGLALVAQYARLMRARMRLRTADSSGGFVCEIAFPVVPAPAA